MPFWQIRFSSYLHYVISYYMLFIIKLRRHEPYDNRGYGSVVIPNASKVRQESVPARKSKG